MRTAVFLIVLESFVAACTAWGDEAEQALVPPHSQAEEPPHPRDREPASARPPELASDPNRRDGAAEEASRSGGAAIDEPDGSAPALSFEEMAARMPCGPKPGQSTRLDPDPATAAIQFEVAEAALRDLFAAGDRRHAGRVCIRLFGGDPPHALMDALSDLGRPLRAASKFRKQRHDVILRVDDILLVDETHAEVNGGYYEAMLSASGDRLWLERWKGQWAVVRREQCWIA
jgi:hypothetical protein